MISRAAIEKHTRRCADELVEIVESATRLANRTGNTFVLDRQRVASMIAGHFSAALAAEGLALVPVEPTPEMIRDGYNAAVREIDGDYIGTIEVQSIVGRSVYRAMLKAAGASDAGK